MSMCHAKSVYPISTLTNLMFWGSFSFDVKAIWRPVFRYALWIYLCVFLLLSCYCPVIVNFVFLLKMWPFEQKCCSIWLYVYTCKCFSHVFNSSESKILQYLVTSGTIQQLRKLLPRSWRWQSTLDCDMSSSPDTLLILLAGVASIS